MTDFTRALLIACNNSDIAEALKILSSPGCPRLAEIVAEDGVRPLHTAVLHNDISFTKTLLEYAPEVEYFGKLGDSILTYACRIGNVDMVDLLISHMLWQAQSTLTTETRRVQPSKAKSSESDGSAEDRVQTVPWDVTEATRLEFAYALGAALTHGHLPLCDHLLERYNVDLARCYTPAHFSLLLNVCASNIKDEEEWTHCPSWSSPSIPSEDATAATSGEDQSHSTVSPASDVSKTAVYAHRLANMCSAVEWLLAHHMDVNLPCDYKDTPLSMACAFDYTELVSLLLARRAAPNFAGEPYFHPLMSAIRHRNAHIVRMLLDARCDPNIEVHDWPDTRYTALDCARREQCEDIISLLTEHCAEGNKLPE